MHWYVKFLFVSHCLANQIWRLDIISLEIQENNYDCYCFCRFHHTADFQKVLTVKDQANFQDTWGIDSEWLNLLTTSVAILR